MEYKLHYSGMRESYIIINIVMLYCMIRTIESHCNNDLLRFKIKYACTGKEMT